VSAKVIAVARSGVADGSIPGRLTTTSIMILAVLGGLQYHPTSARIVVLFTLVTGMGLYVASVYGDGFGREFATGRPVSTPDLHELLLSPANITALMLWLWTTVFFVALVAGLLSLSAAFQLSESSLVALLFGLGYRSPRKSGRNCRNRLRDGLIVAAIGWLLADMRMLAELVKQF
jgi:hypothetical protein